MMKVPTFTGRGLLALTVTWVAQTFLLSNVALAADPATMPTVVELFTSQGCSSCPPAEAVLGELAKESNVIALAYHVDYWDDLGWRDRFGIPEAAQRQRGYVQALRLSTAFTPQSIVNGRSSVLGSDRRAIAAAIGKQSDSSAIKLMVNDGVLTIALSERMQTGQLDVNLITYLPEASTAIGRGENSGRTLKEFNVVRSVRRLARWDGHSSNLTVPLSSLPADASRVAVLLQQPDQGFITGAAVTSLR
jgi:hypothetical protein